MCSVSGKKNKKKKNNKISLEVLWTGFWWRVVFPKGAELQFFHYNNNNKKESLSSSEQELSVSGEEVGTQANQITALNRRLRKLIGEKIT